MERKYSLTTADLMRSSTFGKFLGCAQPCFQTISATTSVRSIAAIASLTTKI